MCDILYWKIRRQSIFYELGEKKITHNKIKIFHRHLGPNPLFQVDINWWLFKFKRWQTPSRCLSRRIVTLFAFFVAATYCYTTVTLRLSCVTCASHDCVRRNTHTHTQSQHSCSRLMYVRMRTDLNRSSRTTLSSLAAQPKQHRRGTEEDSVAPDPDVGEQRRQRRPGLHTRIIRIDTHTRVWHAGFTLYVIVRPVTGRDCYRRNVVLARSI